MPFYCYNQPDYSENEGAKRTNVPKVPFKEDQIPENQRHKLIRLPIKFSECADFNSEEAKKVYVYLIANGITSDRIILIPHRFTCEPTPKQLSEIAGGKPFQSPACLTGCQKPTEFCSLSWDKKVNRLSTPRK